MTALGQDQQLLSGGLDLKLPTCQEKKEICDLIFLQLKERSFHKGNKVGEGIGTASGHTCNVHTTTKSILYRVFAWIGYYCILSVYSQNY